MKKYIFSLFLLTNSFISFSSGDNIPAGARSSGMGNASVTFTDVWSAQNNQAGLGFVRTISAGAFYENKFLLKQLGVKAGVIALPVKGGTFGLLISNYGYSLYNENKYALSFAKAFGEKLSFGVSMDYLNTTIGEGYGRKNMFVAEMGILSKPMKNLSIGAHLFNPSHTRLADYNDERLPTIFKLGCSYTFSDKVLLSVETQKDISHNAQFKAGLEYRIIKEVYLRMGINSKPVLSSFGIGVQLKNWQMDLSAQYHQVLGVSPQFSLTYFRS